MRDQPISPLTLEAAAADAEVDVETYWMTLQTIEHLDERARPATVKRADHARVMLSLSLPPPPI